MLWWRVSGIIVGFYGLLMALRCATLLIGLRSPAALSAVGERAIPILWGGLAVGLALTWLGIWLFRRGEY